jgi:hypothetical protein
MVIISSLGSLPTKTPCVFGYYNIIYIIAGLASDDINDIIIRTKANHYFCIQELKCYLQYLPYYNLDLIKSCEKTKGYNLIA